MKATNLHNSISVAASENLVVLVTLMVTLLSQLFMPFVLVMNSMENVLFLPLIYVLFTSQKVNFKSVPIYFYFLLIFGLSIVLSNFINGAGLSGYLFAFRPVKYFVLGVAVFSFYPHLKAEFKQVITSIVVLSLIVNIVMLLNPFGWGVNLLKLYSNHSSNYELNAEISKNFRLFGTFNSPNDNAVFWSLILIFITSCWSFFQKNFRNFVIISALIFIVLTQSRTTIVAIILAMSLLFIIKKFNIKTFVVLIAITLTGYMILINSELSYLKQLTNFNILKIRSLTMRYDAWEACIELWKDHKILGIGNQKSTVTLTGYHPDSEYIFVLVTGGLALITSYLLFFVTGIINSFRNINKNPKAVFFIAASAFLLVTAITNIGFLNPELAIVFVILTAITCSQEQSISK